MSIAQNQISQLRAIYKLNPDIPKVLDELEYQFKKNNELQAENKRLRKKVADLETIISKKVAQGMEQMGFKKGDERRK